MCNVTCDFSRNNTGFSTVLVLPFPHLVIPSKFTVHRQQYHKKYKNTTEAYNNMHIHRLKVIMYVYDISASYRLDLQIFLGILILFSFW